MPTVWILGDQLNRGIASLTGVPAGAARILFIESEAALTARRWHRQRLHLVLTAMRRFAAELEAEGFAVDYRRAPSFRHGLAAHRRRFRPPLVRVMEPSSLAMRDLVRALGVETVRSKQFLCHYEDFGAWAAGRPRLRMEEFYRWQRTRLGYLMDGDRPVGGRWNWDEANRLPPPRAEDPWSPPLRSTLDKVDDAVLRALPAGLVGAAPDGVWATSRAEALERLHRFVSRDLPRFGPYQDAMTERSWHLAHSRLSPYLNLGLLTPAEVCQAVEAAYRSGAVPIASAEGFLRQIIGWREYVWGIYWLWMPGYRAANALGADRPLPPAFLGAAQTRMRCLASALRAVHEHAYAHHIQRLMVLGNLALLAGVAPVALVGWMWERFIDGAEWVMVPNVIGMALYADGGRMATKPYAAGGAYIRRMSDHCARCPYDPAKRTGADACPYTTLYWAFVDRHADRFAANPRMRRAIAGLRCLPDRVAVRRRAAEVLSRLDDGTL